jgi:xylose isomerase
MKPETLVKISVAMLSEAEQEFRYKADAVLVESMERPWKVKENGEYERLMDKADAILEAIEKLNTI